MFDFAVEKTLHEARLTRLETPHGAVAGPFFQFVATQAGFKGQVYGEDLAALGGQILLANTYHLYVRPGEDVIAEAGGLHDFMDWAGPIITDSGGYQVFSLSKHLELDDDGVTFRSPLDGAEHRLTPESTIQIQTKLKGDIIMPLDIATAFDASRDEVATAVEQTGKWAARCLAEHERLAEQRTQPQALYGIVQGGLFEDLRERAAAELTKLDFFGYSIGGELRHLKESRMEEGARMTCAYLPTDKPRYLMGAGAPADIVRAVRVGVDQFDCVLPLRDARHGRLYQALNEDEVVACLTDPERPVEPEKLYTTIHIAKRLHERDWSPFAAGNPLLDGKYTVGYVHHLFRAEPPSGYRLAVLNNMYFYVRLLQVIRETIAERGAAQPSR